MAGCKNRQVRQKEMPLGKSIAQGGNPEHYYNENPAWVFHVLWFDDKHGDNSACVCRSYLKHT